MTGRSEIKEVTKCHTKDVYVQIECKL